jgi:CHAT domain-containing protein
LKYLLKADSISKKVELTRSRYLDLQNSLGELYSGDHNYDFLKSKSYRLKNLKIGIKHKDSFITARSYNNLAHLYNKEKKDSALYYIKQGLKFENFPEAKARLHDNLADYQIRKEQLNEAVKSIHTSLEIMTNSEINEVPSDFQISQSPLLDYTLYCLKKKAEIYLRLYQRDFDKSYLEDALKNIERAEYVVGLLLNGTTEESTQIIWRREASQAYLYGAYAAHLLGDREKAFFFMEKNKALLLSEGVLKNTEFANLPKHISDEETRRKKQIYRLENLLSKQEGNSILQDSLFTAKRSHERYIDSLKVQYPKYFARKINVDQIALSDVQKELKPDDAIVSFIWNDFDAESERALGLVATKETSLSFEVKDIKDVRETLKVYRSLISQPFETRSDQEAFQKVAFELYEQLFPTKEARAMIQGKNLMIIPDGDLQNIPFESLITQENTNKYLIYNGDVNYSYSYSFLKHNEKVDRKTTESFIGYSPIEFKSLSLATLRNTKEELDEINMELNGILKLQDIATKADFLQNTSQSKIIHLATHADAGANPWIAFADDKLELHELYTYKNNADLVTLSACNTSLGDVAKGEGVLSLARGFFYSGSKSVVSSLWEVNDQSTSDIMSDFYGNLKSGQTKLEAINNAKRTYLSNHSLSEQSPYYWSSFILIGDTGTIDISSNLYLYLVGIVLVFLTILIFRKKTKIYRGPLS